MKHFGHAVISTPMAAIDEVFREVAAGAVNFGVVPVENSTEGAVNHTLDSFLEHDMVICGEVELRIHHHLLVGDTTKTDNITRIYSHAQSWPSAASGWTRTTRTSSASLSPAMRMPPSG